MRRCVMSAKKSAASSETTSQGDGSSGLRCLLAFDGSEHSHAAVTLVMDLPQKRGPSGRQCSVTLMSVLPTQSIAGHEHMQDELNAAEKRLSDAGFEVN